MNNPLSLRDRLAASGFAQHLGRNHFFLKISDAVLATGKESVPSEGIRKSLYLSKRKTLYLSLHD